MKHFLIWNKIKSTDSDRLKMAERALILLSSRSKTYIASTSIWGVPMIALYNKMWQKCCCTSFWMQTMRGWQHLPPGPYKTLLEPWAAIFKVWLSWQCRAGEVCKQMLQSTVSAKHSLPDILPRHQTSERRCLAFPRPAYLPGKYYWGTSTETEKKDLLQSPSSFPHSQNHEM